MPLDPSTTAHDSGALPAGTSEPKPASSYYKYDERRMAHEKEAYRLQASAAAGLTHLEC
jgi:hypothetical protein